MRTLRLLVALAALAACAACVAATDVHVTTRYGPIVGTVASGVRVFKGVPFAAPPVGQLRWRPPVPPSPWSAPLDCKHGRGICPQINVDRIIVGSEDCLYLNVWVPDDIKAGEKLPVMVWIYGGGYTIGDATEFGLYNGENLVKNNRVILVAMNYRLSTFGFLALPDMMIESETAGNFGPQDQRMALMWVRDNIAAFGGDPSRVTIFGESAGAFSVCWHLASRASIGLFHAAIMESGTCDAPQFFVPFEKAVEWSEEYAADIGCNPNKTSNVLQCLRGKSTAAVMNGILKFYSSEWIDALAHKLHIPVDLIKGLIPPLSPVMPWGPTIDGTDFGLHDVPLTVIQRGEGSLVPLLLGTNRDEGSIFVPAMPMIVPGVLYPLGPGSVELALKHFFNETVARTIEAFYPASEFDSQDNRVSSVLRDYFFVCSNRRAARAMASHGVPVYLYHFTYPMHWVEYGLVGNYHMSELFFVFDNAWPIVLHSFNADDRAMASAFGKYWTNFARNHTPNSADVPVQWPVYSQSSDANIVMSKPVSTMSGLRAAECDFWDKVPPVQ